MCHVVQKEGGSELCIMSIDSILCVQWEIIIAHVHTYCACNGRYKFTFIMHIIVGVYI